MKKLLLTIGVAIISLATNAQTSVVLYSGESTDFANSNGYSFDTVDTYVKDSSILGNKVVYFSGTAATGNYVGGFGLESYPVKRFSTAFSGTVENSVLSFNAFTNGTNATVKVQLQADTNTWGYVFDLTAVATVPATLSAKLSNFKKNVANQPTGDTLTDDDFVKVTAIQFVIGVPTAAGGTATLIVDDIKLDETTVAGLGDGSALAVSEEIVSAYDMLGNFVGKGKVRELGLEAGRTYIVKSNSSARKIVIVK